RTDLFDPRLRMMVARADACLGSGERDRGQALVLEAHRHQGRGDRLAVGDEHVQLSWRRIAADPPGELDKTVGRLAHGGHHSDHLVAGSNGLSDAPANAPDADGVGDGRAPVFLDDHEWTSRPWRVALVTSP